MKKKRKKKQINKFIRILTLLVVSTIIFFMVNNKNKDNHYRKNKIDLLIDNENITERLENDLFITDKKVIYMSMQDVSKYFDNSIIFNEDKKEIITTYGEKVVKLPLNKNVIEINNREEDVLSGAIKKENIYYIPITSMGKIYEIDIDYIEENNILILDSRIKKLIKADISKKCNVKEKVNSFSKNIAQLEKADKVIVIEHLKNNWTKIRTKNGIIGYVKTKILQNEIYIRDDLKL